MEKDFDSWNIQKQKTHQKEKVINFYEREVWWCIMGVNVGVEIDGKHKLFLRPVIVIRKFNKDMALVVATTAQDKQNKYYFVVSGDDGKSYNSCLSQVRNISSKRLFRKIGTINETSYKALIRKVSSLVEGKL